jgi:hypothetical protein
MRDRRYGEFTQPWRERAQIPTPRLAAHLVECKIEKKPWRTVLRIYSEDVRAELSKRATEILSGDKPKARKNFIEARASEIATELQNEWFGWKGRKGRPPGKRTHGNDNWLSLDEIVTTVAPLIEEIAGTELKPVAVPKAGIRSPAFEAFVAAIRSEHPRATFESIRRTLARLRAKGRSRTAPIS